MKQIYFGNDREKSKAKQKEQEQEKQESQSNRRFLRLPLVTQDDAALNARDDTALSAQDDIAINGRPMRSARKMFVDEGQGLFRGVDGAFELGFFYGVEDGLEAWAR